MRVVLFIIFYSSYLTCESHGDVQLGGCSCHGILGKHAALISVRWKKGKEEVRWEEGKNRKRGGEVKEGREEGGGAGREFKVNIMFMT